MFDNQNGVCSPYGAFELKASYQRNLLFSNFVVSGLAILITAACMVLYEPVRQGIIIIPKGPIEVSRDLKQLPTITHEPRQLPVKPPSTELPALAQLVPVDNEKSLENDSQVITKEEVVDDGNSGEVQPTGDSIGTITFDTDGLLPGINQFVPVEQVPEFIQKAIPNYPRFERMAGIEGTVWIVAEVDIDGSVSNAKIYKSSGRISLDQAALYVAFKNTFRPAIQNGNPVKLWTAYEVEFVLNR